ncbi:MAG: hypothetical protein ABMA01_19030, partial [Chthoniobacteraceae bacterium]
GEGTYFQQSPAHSEAANWASFNAGEFLWPGSRRSIAPLLLMWIGAGLLMIGAIRRERAPVKTEER